MIGFNKYNLEEGIIFNKPGYTATVKCFDNNHVFLKIESAFNKVGNNDGRIAQYTWDEFNEIYSSAGLGKGNKMKYNWELWILDVWGNEIDGYEVNNRSKLKIVELSKDATDQEILDVIGISDCADLVTIDGDDMMIFVDDIDGMPLYQLTAINNN